MESSYILKRLEKAYPSKIISDFYNQHASLYNITAAYARENGLSITEFLEVSGFQYIRRPTRTPTGFDAETASLLFSEYGVTQVDFAGWFNVTRGAIHLRMTSQATAANWISTTLSNEEEEIVADMAERRIFTFAEDEIIVAIRTNFYRPCIIVIRDGQTKVVFDIQEPTRGILGKHQLDIFRQLDFELKQDLVPVSIFGTIHATIERPGIRHKVMQLCEKRGISIDAFCKLHGFEGGYCSPNTASDDEIIEMIETHDNLVFIQSYPNGERNLDYFKFTNRASRANMTLDELFRFFGFIKVDSRLESNYQNKMVRHIEELQQLVVVGTENKVIIRTDSSLYRRLYPFAQRRGISLDTLLHELGFERVYAQVAAFEVPNEPSEAKGNDRSQLIREIEGLQGRLERSVTPTERISRNKALVTKLKELYDYRCQICDEQSGLPAIEKQDGTFYVEVHHIFALGTAAQNQPPDEYDDQLDTYKNAIVICPFHHKVLHYHHGGFEHLITQNNNLHFISKRDTLLRVCVNHHLRLNETGNHLYD